MKTRFFLLFVACFCLFSCQKNKQGQVADLSDLTSVSIEQKWAVITEPYVALKKEPNINSEISFHGRRGDVMLVIGKSFKKKNGITEVWYCFENGWLVESSLRIYSNKLQAENAANSLL